MFQAYEIESEARKIIGTCSDELFYRWCTDCVQLIAAKGEFNAWEGFLDICSTGGGRCITLPREVQTVIAVNICGRPALAKSSLFDFHLNGPGTRCQGCEFSWADRLDNHSVYRDLTCPSKLVAYVSSAADNNSELIVHGYDSLGNKLRHSVGGEFRDGLLIPTVFGYAIPDASAPLVARITGVTKAITQGSVRLSTIDDSGDTGTLLAVYEPDERLPQYRRIKINRGAPQFTIAYRKTNPTITSRFDRIPLKSRLGFLLGIKALKYYHDNDLGLAHGFEADAARLEIEQQNIAEPPTFHPLQVVDLNSLRDKNDYDVL